MVWIIQKLNVATLRISDLNQIVAIENNSHFLTMAKKKF